MKAITIKQPWASLISFGLKDMENRTWKTNFRGRVLIHAGKSRDKQFGMPKELYSKKEVHSIITAKELPQGSIIGSVEIVDCVQNHPSLWALKGVWNWVLDNPILFDKPIEGVKGKLGLWNYDYEENMQQEQEKASIIEENKDDAVLDSLLVREMAFTTPLSIARMHPVVDLPPLPDKFISGAKVLPEKVFREKVSVGTKQMMEHLTVGEQLRVSFVPLIITYIA